MDKKGNGVTAIVLFIAGGLLLLLAIFLFVSSMLDGDLIPVKAQVSNVYEAVDPSDPEKLIPAVTVAFKTEDGTFATGVLPDHSTTGYKVGQWVDIYYSRSNPAKIRLTKVDPVVEIICFALGAAALGLGFFFLARSKRDRA